MPSSVLDPKNIHIVGVSRAHHSSNDNSIFRGGRALEEVLAS